MTTTITCSVFVSLSEETSDIWRPSPVFLWSSPWSVSKYVNNVSIRQFSSPAFQRGPLFVIQSLANWPTTLLLRSLSSLIDHRAHLTLQKERETTTTTTHKKTNNYPLLSAQVSLVGNLNWSTPLPPINTDRLIQTNDNLQTSLQIMIYKIKVHKLSTHSTGKALRWLWSPRSLLPMVTTFVD